MQLLFSSVCVCVCFFLSVHIVSFFLFKLIRLICILKSWAFSSFIGCVCVCSHVACVCCCCFRVAYVKLSALHFGVIAKKHEYVPLSTDFRRKTRLTFGVFLWLNTFQLVPKNQTLFFFLHLSSLVLAFRTSGLEPNQKHQLYLFLGHPFSFVNNQTKNTQKKVGSKFLTKITIEIIVSCGLYNAMNCL